MFFTLILASAIKAQWGRHVFKSKEARISFFRNAPTNALMLDGTAGVNDKQVRGQCSQYGAIKEIIMDPDGVLALVQFQEVSYGLVELAYLYGFYDYNITSTFCIDRSQKLKQPFVNSVVG